LLSPGPKVDEPRAHAQNADKQQNLAELRGILAVLHVADKFRAGVRLHGQLMLGQPAQRPDFFYRPAQLFHPEEVYGESDFRLSAHHIASFLPIGDILEKWMFFTGRLFLCKVSGFYRTVKKAAMASWESALLVSGYRAVALLFRCSVYIDSGVIN